MMSKSKSNDAAVLDGKMFAVLSYLSILCIIPLIFKKDNEFVLSHGKQGLVLFVSEVAVFILSIVIPWMFRLGMFVLLLMSFVGIISVLKGKFVRLPVISDVADSIIL